MPILAFRKRQMQMNSISSTRIPTGTVETMGDDTPITLLYAIATGGAPTEKRGALNYPHPEKNKP
jgi:hypothetical protein